MRRRARPAGGCMSDDDDLHYEITVSDGDEAIGRFEVRGAVERDVLIA